MFLSFFALSYQLPAPRGSLVTARSFTPSIVAAADVSIKVNVKKPEPANTADGEPQKGNGVGFSLVVGRLEADPPGTRR